MNERINLLQIWWNNNIKFKETNHYKFWLEYKDFFIDNFNYILFTNNDIISFLKKYNLEYILDKIKNVDFRLQSDILRFLILSKVGGFYLDLDIKIYNFEKFKNFILNLNKKYQNFNIIPQSKHIFFLKIVKNSKFVNFLLNYYLKSHNIKVDTYMIKNNWVFKNNDLIFLDDNKIYKVLTHYAITG